MLPPTHHVWGYQLKMLHADLMRDLLTAKVYFPTGSSQHKSLKHSKFAASPYKQEEYMAKLFGKFLPHVTLSGCI